MYQQQLVTATRRSEKHWSSCFIAIFCWESFGPGNRVVATWPIPHTHRCRPIRPSYGNTWRHSLMAKALPAILHTMEHGKNCSRCQGQRDKELKALNQTASFPRSYYHERGYFVGWCVSSGIHIINRTQDFPSDHCILNWSIVIHFTRQSCWCCGWLVYIYFYGKGHMAVENNFEKKRESSSNCEMLFKAPKVVKL